MKNCRKAGYAYDPGKINAGIMAISAPVFGANVQIIGCIIRQGAFPKIKIKSYGPKVATAVASMSQKRGVDPGSLPNTLD